MGLPDQTITIVVPRGMFGASDDDDALTRAMRHIASANDKKDGDWVDKYGVHVDNDIFMMHPYCWCEKDDCPWCGGCQCVPDTEAYLDGVRVNDWWAENKKIVKPLPWTVAIRGTTQYKKAKKEFDLSIKERDKRLTRIYPAVIHTCGHPMMANRERGQFGPPQTAPNFWHKASGFRVWWYKYIGRDMQTNDIVVDLTMLVKECS